MKEELEFITNSLENAKQGNIKSNEAYSNLIRTAKGNSSPIQETPMSAIHTPDLSTPESSKIDSQLSSIINPFGGVY